MPVPFVDAVFDARVAAVTPGLSTYRPPRHLRSAEQRRAADSPGAPPINERLGPMISTRMYSACFAAILLTLVPAQPALAHEGASLPNSLKHGFLHPLLGVDHLAAMVAVGLLSAVSLRGAIWRLPLAFVCALLVGGIAGFNGYELLGVELWVMGSLIAMGVVLITTKSIGLRWALVAVSVFGFAHGNAHGLELPAAVSATAFTAGFTAASILCHLAGVALGVFAQRSRWSASMLRVGGALLVGQGALLLSNA